LRFKKNTEIIPIASRMIESFRANLKFLSLIKTKRTNPKDRIIPYIKPVNLKDIRSEMVETKGINEKAFLFLT
jgi:hypothetical protein